MSEKIVAITDRKGTASEWTSSNPVLALGEHGYETDTKKEKIGDGTTAWTSLPYKTTDVIPQGSNNLYFTTVRAISTIFGNGVVQSIALTSTLTLPFSSHHARYVYATTSLTSCTISMPATWDAGIPQYCLIRNAGSSDLVLTLATEGDTISTDYTITVGAGSSVEISYMAYNYLPGNPNWVVTVSAPISWQRL